MFLISFKGTRSSTVVQAFNSVAFSMLDNKVRASMGFSNGKDFNQF